MFCLAMAREYRPGSLVSGFVRDLLQVADGSRDQRDTDVLSCTRKEFAETLNVF